MSESKHYKLLILDYGGVYSFEYNIAAFDTIMKEPFGVVPNDSDKEKIAQYSRQLAANHITTDRYIAEVAKILDSRTHNVVRFEEATMRATFDPSEPMKALVDSVKAHGIRVSLLSDMYLFEVEKTRPWGRYDQFDYTSFSAEAGFTKADPEFFMQTLQHFGCNPDDVLFVDDIKRHIQTAQKVGIDTLHADKTVYISPSSLVEAIRAKLSI